MHDVNKGINPQAVGSRCLSCLLADIVCAAISTQAYLSVICQCVLMCGSLWQKLVAGVVGLFVPTGARLWNLSSVLTQRPTTCVSVCHIDPGLQPILLQDVAA